MAKKREKLTPIPDPPAPSRSRKPPSERQAGLPRTDEPQGPPPPDLSYIAADLRPLALPIADLEFLPANPRLHGEKDLAAIRASLATFRQLKPIVVNTSTTPPQVVAGNGTMQAALALGWTHLAVVRQEMSESEAAAFSIADNATALGSSWDKEGLDAALRLAKTGDEVLQTLFSELAEAEGLIPHTEGAKAEPAADDKYKEQYGVIVICADEATQAEVYERLSAEGLNCKVVTT